MTNSNVIPFHRAQAHATSQSSVWVLFVLEDLRLHFLDAQNDRATHILEDTIQKLEPTILNISADMAAPSDGH